MNDRIEMARHRWDELVVEFIRFFAGRGTVTTSSTSVRFEAEHVGTALELRADGTSSSFMPLHALDGRWDTVVFDDGEDAVTLIADTGRYEYRVPPALQS